MLLTIQVSLAYPSQLREQLRNAFEDAGVRVEVTDEPSKEAYPVLCLCEDFKTKLIDLARRELDHLKNDGDLKKSPRGPSTFTQRFDYTFKNGIINGTFSSSRNLVAPRVSDAQSGNEETDAMLSVNAVLFYDNAKEFSLYKYELEQLQTPCSHFFKPMWNIWPRQPWLQSAAAKIEVAKMLKRKEKT